MPIEPSHSPEGRLNFDGNSRWETESLIGAAREDEPEWTAPIYSACLPAIEADAPAKK